MQTDIVSVSPEYFDVTGLSLLGKAQEKGLVTIRAHNLRDWTHDVHHCMDDTPVGGGADMVTKPEIRAECLFENLRYSKEILDTRHVVGPWPRDTGCPTRPSPSSGPHGPGSG